MFATVFHKNDYYRKKIAHCSVKKTLESRIGTEKRFYQNQLTSFSFSIAKYRSNVNDENSF